MTKAQVVMEPEIFEANYSEICDHCGQDQGNGKKLAFTLDNLKEERLRIFCEKKISRKQYLINVFKFGSEKKMKSGKGKSTLHYNFVY